MIRKHPIFCKMKGEERLMVHNDTEISVNILRFALDRDVSYTVQTSRKIKITLSFLAIIEHTSSTAFFPIGYSENITCRTGNVLWFSDQFTSPWKERNLESVSPGPVGKTSLHISYVGVHSRVSILVSSLLLIWSSLHSVIMVVGKPSSVRSLRGFLNDLKRMELAADDIARHVQWLNLIGNIFNVESYMLSFESTSNGLFF